MQNAILSMQTHAFTMLSRYLCIHLQTQTGVYKRLGILDPPSSRITVPLSMTFSTTALTSAANSCPVPPLFGNSMLFSRLFRTLSLMTAVMGVSNVPGAIVTTRIPKRDKSRVSGSVMLATAPLDAA